MADKLPWFPFYATDWVTDPRVLALSNEQRGIFHWLLCRQWMDGHLPGDPMYVYPLLPPGGDSAAVGYVLNQFFPTDPDDATKRSNPRLCDIRCEQEAKLQSEKNKTKAARAAKAAKRLPTTTYPRSVTASVTEVDIESETEKEKAVGKHHPETPVGLPPEVAAALRPYLNVGETSQRARVGEIKMWLGGAKGPVSQEAVVRGLQDMVVANKPFTPLILRAFIGGAVKLINGEAGAKAGQDSLKAQSSVLGHPGANQTPSGFSEDELE